MLLAAGAPVAAAPAAQDEEPDVEFFYSLVTKRPVIERELEFVLVHAKGREGRETEAAFAVEFPVLPRWQIEVEVPFVIVDPRDASTQAGFGDLEIQNKFLLFRSVEHRALVAAGFELKLPSGSERRGLGGELAIEPFVSAGIGLGPIEVLSSVAWERNLREDEQVLEANLAVAWILNRYVVPLVEVNTVTPLAGDEDHRTQVFITPGLNVRVAPGSTARVGIQVPVTRAREFDYALHAGLTWEF
jgi:hypothetical protein